MLRSAAIVLALVGLSPIGQAQNSESATAKARRSGSAARVAPTAALSMRIPEIAFDGVPAERVFEQLATQLRINVMVRWERLEAAGIARDAGVTVRARNLRLAQVLWLIFNQPPFSEARLAYRADQNLLIISTAEDFDREMITRVYDVQDLIQPHVTNPTAAFGREFDTVSTVIPSVAPGAVGVTPVIQRRLTGVVWGDSVENVAERGDNDDDVDLQARYMAQLVDAITTTIEPESWSTNGGPGSIVPWRGRLIVRNTLAVHQRIGGPITER